MAARAHYVVEEQGDRVLKHSRPRPRRSPFILPSRPSLVAAPPAGSGWLHEMKHMPHGARASFALVSLREDATFVGGRYDNWNCPMVRRP